LYVSGRSAKQRLNTRPETAIHDTRSAIWNALSLGAIHGVAVRLNVRLCPLAKITAIEDEIEDEIHGALSLKLD
jgi:hypothetical protein